MGILKKQSLKNSMGFSLIELLTTVSIIGIISTIGIRSYMSQINKARTAEAKHSLSSLYKGEKQFKLEWGTYHENLAILGVIPEEEFFYDLGFHPESPLSITDGRLEDWPDHSVLTHKECTNWKQICDGSCADRVPVYFDRKYFRCSVTGDYSISTIGGSGTTEKGTSYSSFEATESEFKGIATAKIQGKNDIWSINHEKKIIHETDGTE